MDSKCNIRRIVVYRATAGAYYDKKSKQCLGTFLRKSVLSRAVKGSERDLSMLNSHCVGFAYHLQPSPPQQLFYHYHLLSFQPSYHVVSSLSSCHISWFSVTTLERYIGCLHSCQGCINYYTTSLKNKLKSYISPWIMRDRCERKGVNFISC